MMIAGLFWLLVSLQSNIANADMWTAHTDRIYMRKVMHPFISQFSKLTNDPICEIGMEGYNVDDCNFIDIPCHNFYIVDMCCGNHVQPPDKGTFVNSVFADLGKRPEFVHKFGLIFDFGVLGFIPFKWTNEAIEEHIKAYRTMLRPGGTLLLKWDLQFRFADHAKYWLMAEPLLHQSLHLVGQHMIHNGHCNPTQESQLKKLYFHSHTAEHDAYMGGGFNHTELVEAAGPREGCEMYLFSQWRAPLTEDDPSRWPQIQEKWKQYSTRPDSISTGNETIV